MTASAREQYPRSACGRRDGVAAVEFAVCLPVLLVLTFGMIEACTMMFLKQSLSIAAYEGAHTLVRPNATPAEAKKVVQAILNARRVEGATVSISPGNFTSLPEGDPFQVTVSAPAATNGLLTTPFYAGKTLSAGVTFLKENP